MIEFVMYLAVATAICWALNHFQDRIKPDWDKTTYFAASVLAALVWPILLFIVLLTVIVETAKEKR